MNLDMLQELCTALTAAALDDDEASLSAADFLKVDTCSCSCFRMLSVLRTAHFRSFITTVAAGCRSGAARCVHHGQCRSAMA